MPVLIEFSYDVAAPPERLFDLSRSVEAHVESVDGTGERAVGGVTSGLLGLGDEVTWEARHLGVRQRLTSRITAFDRPRHFRDEMQRGAFRSLAHDHTFEAIDGGTRVTERLEFAAPFGPLGRLAEVLVLRRHMTRFLRERADALTEIAESGRWRDFLVGD